MKLIPGMRPQGLEDLFKYYDAIIIESFGVGGIPSSISDDFYRLNKQYPDTMIIMATQVAHEGSDMTVYEVGNEMKSMCNFLESYDMTLESVIAKTMWMLANTDISKGNKEDVFYKNINFDVIFGKNRINFYEDSGFMDTGCVKMSEEYYLTLPGGFVLPVALLRQTEITYTCETSVRSSDAVESMLAEESRSYLLKQMIAGEILSTTQEFMDGCYEAEYVCREMIGRLVYEEFTYDYGQDH